MTLSTLLGFNVHGKLLLVGYLKVSDDFYSQERNRQKPTRILRREIVLYNSPSSAFPCHILKLDH